MKTETVDLLIKAMLSKEGSPINIEDSKKKVVDAANNSKAINDAYGNSLTGVGTSDNIQKYSNYNFSNDTMNWMLWTALYNDSWVFRRAIDKPSQDMVRSGITIFSDNGADLKQIYKDYKMYRSDFINLIQWGRLFGGSIAVMMFDNLKDKDYSKPLDVEKIKQSKSMRLYVTDRWYGVSPSNTTVSSMNSLDFGKPESYNITFADGSTFKVHHDYILRYEHRTAPRLVKNGQLQGWGYAEGAHILNEIARDDQLKSDITSLINKSLIEVIKMSGMTGIFMGADEDNEAQLRKRLEMVNWGRNFNSLTFLDKDDEYQQNQFSGLSGLAQLLEQNMWQVSAALDMQGVLYGHLNNGFSEDNEALERYDETIQCLNNSYFRPVVEKWLWVEFKKYGIKENIEFNFNSLLSSKHDKERMEGIKSYQELLSNMMGDGVLNAQQYAKAMVSFLRDGILDLYIDEKSIEELKDTIEEEMEDIDLNENSNQIDEKTKKRKSLFGGLFKKDNKDEKKDQTIS